MQAVTEAARVISPLSIAISNGIVNSLVKLYDHFDSKRSVNQRVVNDLVYALKMEYPFESNEYLHHIALKMLEDARNA